ncbi:unnamed protein product [Trichobilharzia regenti]|nr:unnamed protein product [Trichobilharzia regenti]
MCDGKSAVQKPVVASGKPLLNKVSQTTPQFVQEKRVTVSESASDSTSLQRIPSQTKGIKPLRFCEEEPKSSTAVIKEVENDEVEHTNGVKVDIVDSGHGSADLSLHDHDETSGIPTTAKLNKASVQLEREVELKADAVAEGMDTCETVSVNDERVAHLLTDANA